MMRSSTLLLLTLSTLLALSACADDSSDRQFAGDEQSTALATVTVPAQLSPFPPGSPVAVASPLLEEALFAIRGDATSAAFVSNGAAYRYRSEDGEPQQIAIDPALLPWLVDLAPDGKSIAILVSPRGSVEHWNLLILDADGNLIQDINVVGGNGSPVPSSEIVTTGTGGADWSPDGKTIAVALPTGGIYAVAIDGGVEQMSPARRTPRPGDVAWSPNGRAIAFASQPKSRSGLGVSLAPATALPLDAVTILSPDPTGNRSASDLIWTPDGKQVLVILDRKETGGQGGDVLAIDAMGGAPDLIWSSGLHIVGSGAEQVSLSPDGQVLAILSRASEGNSILVLKQFDGPSEVRRDLTIPIENAELIWSSDGVVIVGMGTTGGTNIASAPVTATVDDSGSVIVPVQNATPIASPAPAGSPLPVASPATPDSGD